MHFRLPRVLVALAVAACAFAGVARALDFDDEDPEPPHGEVGAVYSYEIGTHAGCLPHRLVVESGELPPGLSIRRIDLDTHVVEGVPTESGTFSAWIALKDCDNKSAETLFTFDIWARRWAIATGALPAASVGSPYSQTLTGTGPDSNVTWTITAGALPAGLTLSPSGAISGTPTAAGSSTFTVKADAKEKNFGPERFDSKQFTLRVVQLAARVARTTAEAGVPFRSTLTASGGQGPYRWSAGAAPAGLSVSVDGTISGVPSRPGTYTFTVRLTDGEGAGADVQVRLVVRKHLVITTKRLPAAAAGSVYRAKLKIGGGVEGLRFTAAGLPRGLKLNARTGAFAGAPAAAGSYRVIFRVRDALGAVAKKTLVLRVG